MEAVIRRSEQGECPVSENAQCEGLETGLVLDLKDNLLMENLMMT